MEAELPLFVVAERYGMKPNTLLQRIRRGYIKATKRYNHWWIPVSELDKLKKTSK